MTREHKIGAALTALFVLAAVRAAAADPAPPIAPPPVFHLPEPSTLTTHAGTVLTLPPGYVLDEPSYAKIDADLKDQQTIITRLTAENNSYKITAGAWRPSLWIIAGAVASGIVVGWYAHDHI